MKVYFLGSGDIAVPVLAALNEASDVDLAGVGTQLDRPAGRKKLPMPTPVGKWCEDNQVPVEKIANVNEDAILARLEESELDFIVVVSFGQILRQPVLDAPKWACVNLHASLLPKYRGASPIVACLLNGDSKTGIGFMRMEKGLDTGPIYAEYEMELNGDEVADKLEMDLGYLGADHIVDVLKRIRAGELKAEPQAEQGASYAGKIKKSDGDIDWSDTPDVICRKIRAYHPWPGANFAVVTPKRTVKINITSARAVSDATGKPGEILQADKYGWRIACGEGAVDILNVVPAGKKEMSGVEFLRGCPLQVGSVL